MPVCLLFIKVISSKVKKFAKLLLAKKTKQAICLVLTSRGTTSCYIQVTNRLYATIVLLRTTKNCIF